MTPKRAVRLAALALIACLIAGAVSFAVGGSQRRTTFDAQAATLQRIWAHDLAVGVPAASITPKAMMPHRPTGDFFIFSSSMDLV